MSMQAKWIAEKEVGADEVVTLLTVNPVKQFPGGALLAIDCPVAVVSEGPPQLSIHLKGETFLPEQEPAKKVLLRETVHGCLPEVRLFREFAGNGVFDVWRRPVVGARRALFVDGAVLIQTEAFREWLLKELVHRVRAATEFIIHQDDPPSKLLAEMVSTVCELELGLAKLPTVAATALRELKLSENAGVVVCAAVIGKGSQLLEVSRALRDKHKGPRLYVVGFQVTEGRSEIKALPLNLKHAKDIQHEFTAFGTAAVGSQLAQSYRAEVSQYYPPSADLPQLPKRIALRASTLGEVDQVGVLALLPCGEATEGELQIRPGFAYWAQGYDTQACQPEILGTVGVLLQRAREDDKVPGEYRLASPSFRHVLLDPENFARFNDGVLQAALLRNAYPSEIDYRSDHSASDFMKSLILRALARATEESGEGLLEFLLALALGRLQLAEVHRDEIVEQATMSHQGPAGLKRAITFVLQPLIGKGGARAKMPF